MSREQNGRTYCYENLKSLSAAIYIHYLLQTALVLLLWVTRLEGRIVRRKIIIAKVLSFFQEHWNRMDVTEWTAKRSLLF